MKKTPKQHYLLANVALLVGSVVLCLVCVEISIRFFAPQNTEPHPRGLYRPDHELGFVLTPQISGVSRSPEWNVQVATNSLGLRERELPRKVNGQRRLIILGDSFTFGAGVEADAAYPRQVEQTLRAAGHHEITVINAGVPAYGTYQEAVWLERIIDQIDPDIILVGFFLGNDFADNLNLNQYEVISGYLVSTSQHGSRLSLTEMLGISAEIKIAVRTRLHLYTLLMNAWSKALVATGWANTDDMFEIYREKPSPETIEEIESTRGALSDLAAACRKRKLPMGLVLIPDGRVAPVLVKKTGYRFGQPAKIVREIGATHKIPVLDLSGMFEANFDVYFPVDGHWNARGHQLAGRAIAESLLGGELRSLFGK